MIQEFSQKQKAIDCAIWLNAIHHELSFYVLEHDNGKYLVCSKENENTDTAYHIPLTTNYTEMDYKDIQALHTDAEPLAHWQNISALISTMDSTLLRFILSHHIPLEKFIRYELSKRGCDDKGSWIGFENSQKFWRK